MKLIGTPAILLCVGARAYQPATDVTWVGHSW